MKVRKGFVSNSSSSSFVCDICGNVESERDAEPSDLGFVECVHGHTVCQDHIPNYDEIVDEGECESGGYEFPAEHCPICQLQEVARDDLVNYAFKKLKLSKDQLKAEIKTTFKTYDEFQGAL